MQLSDKQAVLRSTINFFRRKVITPLTHSVINKVVNVSLHNVASFIFKFFPFHYICGFVESIFFKVAKRQIYSVFR